jgi:hypothetical protein
MQNPPWLAMLRQIPPAFHNALTLVTRIGQEIAIQNIFRMEDDFLVIRGRMAGTTDAGRVFVIPYAELHYLGFQKPLKEEEVDAMLGGNFGSAQATAAPAAAVKESSLDSPSANPKAEEPAAEKPVAEPPPAKPAPEPTPVPTAEKPKPPSSSVLLERVRARLAAQAKAADEAKVRS